MVAVRYAEDKTMTAIAAYAAYCADILQVAQEEKVRKEAEQMELLEKQREEEELVYYWGDNSRVKFLMESGLSLVAACVQAQEEERKWEEDTAAWLADPANRDSDIYSDVFKDLYGFRPRF